jgi:hypothetical protein
MLVPLWSSAIAETAIMAAIVAIKPWGSRDGLVMTLKINRQVISSNWIRSSSRIKLESRRPEALAINHRRGVLFGVLDHKLNVRGRPGNERLGAAEDFVVFVRRGVSPVHGGNDCAVREGKLPFPIGLDCYIVAQLGAQTVEVAGFVGHGDHRPVAVAGGHFGYEDRGGLSPACPDAGVMEATTAATAATANSKKAIRFIRFLLPICVDLACLSRANSCPPETGRHRENGQIPLIDPWVLHPNTIGLENGLTTEV